MWHVPFAGKTISIRVSKQSISPAFQPNSEKFQQGSRTITVFRGVHFRVTSPRPQRLKPNRFAVGNLRKQFGTLKVRRSWKRGRRLQVKVDLFLETGWEPTELGGGAACCGWSTMGALLPPESVWSQRQQSHPSSITFPWLNRIQYKPKVVGWFFGRKGLQISTSTSTKPLSAYG